MRNFSFSHSVFYPFEELSVSTENFDLGFLYLLVGKVWETKKKKKWILNTYFNQQFH